MDYVQVLTTGDPVTVTVTGIGHSPEPEGPAGLLSRPLEAPAGLLLRPLETGKIVLVWVRVEVAVMVVVGSFPPSFPPSDPSVGSASEPEVA